ncbi:MAG: hypothetical protein PVH61_19360 [Candidatus Aminicenantes bacterium]
MKHGQINACGGGLEGCWFYRHFPEKGKKVLIIPYQHDKIPMIGELFHHSIIPSFPVGICRMVDWRFPIINNLQKFRDIKLQKKYNQVIDV